jgi:hypothetical protein
MNMNSLINAAYGFYEEENSKDKGKCIFEFCPDRATKQFITAAQVLSVCQYHNEKLALLAAIRKRDYVTIQNLAHPNNESICCVCDTLSGLHDTDTGFITIPLSEDDNEQSVINICSSCRGAIQEFDDLVFHENMLCCNCNHFFQVDKYLYSNLIDRSKKFKQKGIKTQEFCLDCLSGMYPDLYERRIVTECHSENCAYGSSKVVDFIQFPATCPCNTVLVVNESALEFVEIEKIDKGFFGIHKRGTTVLGAFYKNTEEETLNEIIINNREST